MVNIYDMYPPPTMLIFTETNIVAIEENHIILLICLAIEYSDIVILDDKSVQTQNESPYCKTNSSLITDIDPVSFMIMNKYGLEGVWLA